MSQKSRQASEPTPIQPSQKDESTLVNLGFKVSRLFRRRFKRLAIDGDMTSVELLRQATESYERESRTKSSSTTRQR